MTVYFYDWLTLIGMALTVLGAAVAAVSVMVTKEQALALGTSSAAANTIEERLKSPKVQAYLVGGERARCGLIAVALGTFMQAIPVIARLFS